MSHSVPDWLTRHGGAIRDHPSGHGCIVFINGQPLYSLTVVPAKGKHACDVVQTNNGKRLGKGATYPNVEDALRGGLEDLRSALGW